MAGDTNSNRLAAPTDGDHCYAVTVNGVTVNGTAQRPYEYATCLIDPDAPTGPSVTVNSDVTGFASGTFDVDIAFSEPVAGFTRDDVFVVNGAVQALTGSGPRLHGHHPSRRQRLGDHHGGHWRGTRPAQPPQHGPPSRCASTPGSDDPACR